MGHLYHSYVANYHGGLSSQTETETEGVYTRSKWEFNSMVLVVLEKQKANTWTIQHQSSKCRYIRYGMVDFRPTNRTQRYHWSRTPQSSPYLRALRENGSSHFSTKNDNTSKPVVFPWNFRFFFIFLAVFCPKIAGISGCSSASHPRDQQQNIPSSRQGGCDARHAQASAQPGKSFQNVEGKRFD